MHLEIDSSDSSTHDRIKHEKLYILIFEKGRGRKPRLFFKAKIVLDKQQLSIPGLERRGGQGK